MESVGANADFPRASPRGWLKIKFMVEFAVINGGRATLETEHACVTRTDSDSSTLCVSDSSEGAPSETSGQAGLPAEFKHINKRRKRN